MNTMDDDRFGPAGKLGRTEPTGTIFTDDAGNAVGAGELGETYGTGNATATTDVNPPPGDLGRITPAGSSTDPGDDPLTSDPD